MTDAPLILLGTSDGLLARCFTAAAAARGLPCLHLPDPAGAPPCRFALACEDSQWVAAARLNDRNCTGGLSARMAAQLGDRDLACMQLAWMLGLPVRDGAVTQRTDRIGLLLAPGRAQVIWRSESHDGECFVAHAHAAARLVGVALRTDWRKTKGWGRGLLHLTAAETAQGYGLRAVHQGLPPDLVALAAAGMPMPWGDLLAALLDGTPLCLTPPAPVVCVDAQGRITLSDRLAA